MSLFLVWVTFALGEANQSLLFVLQTAPRGQYKRSSLVIRFVLLLQTQRSAFPPDTQCGFWDHCWGRLVGCGGMHICKKDGLLCALSRLLACLFQCFFSVKFYLPEFWIWFGQFLFGFLKFLRKAWPLELLSPFSAAVLEMGSVLNMLAWGTGAGLCGNFNNTFIYYFLREESRGLGKGWKKGI